VIVRDKDGPVTNLTKGDFALTDQGKLRAIDVFSVETAAPAPASADTLPSNTFSNRAAGNPGSVTMILLDRLNTMIGTSAPGEQTPMFNGDLALASAKQHLLKFVDQMAPTDRIAIYSLGTSLRVLSDFAGDRTQLKTVLQNYRATSITSREVAEPLAANVCPPNDPNGCPINGAIYEDRQALASLSNATRAQTTLEALSAIAAHAGAIPGRKSLVWLTADLAFPPQAIARALSRSGIALYPVDARGLLPTAMARSSANATSQPMGSQAANAMSMASGPAGQPVGVNIMEALADDTGGRAFINNNDIAGAVRQAIDDGAVTYTLGFYVDAGSLDDKFHKLKVHVKRPAAEVRVQKGYFALKDAAPSLAIPTTSPLESSAIHILARIERTGGDLTVSGSIDAHDLRISEDHGSMNGAVDVFLMEQDQAGRVLERRRESLEVRLTTAQYREYLKSGILFRSVVKLKDGLTTFRVIAADPGSGAMGSLIIPVSEIK